MDTIHLIRENLERSEEIVLSRIEEMRDYCVVPPSARGGCHTLWVLGHLAYIEGLDEDDLDQTSVSAPNGADGLFGTYRRCFQYSADHWFMHRGQLADARRAAGIDRMWY